ncbi:hypothetical protein FP2506_10586 [Fulvimarina pelagi HTCC2506]|uniref:Uncharacterized protein n=1 Tax=Fulvimarina pelagi HTCC2506 TaxID=314231 RepID=Q0G4X9_9HYPH|nr:hypothetical protein [Fulvimarina pelagi]EAU43285.1 hypothetical protein FP2506_10586 [Fulvimarina pelagi HTCC2506]
MATVFRFIFVIPVAFVTACLTSAFTVLWPYLGLTDVENAFSPVVYVHSAVAFWAQSAQIGSTLLIPWAVFMAVSEILGLSSLVLHIAAGIAGSVAIIILAYGDPAPSGSIQAAIVISGIVFALTYWVVAGRKAGTWRPRRRADPLDTTPATHD